MRELRDASLIMTVLNEAGSLVAFLESLDGQEVLPREIVVVDGGSTDDTVQVFREWKVPTGCSVKVLVRTGANISEGRNTAIAGASYERILVTDAGTTPDVGWARHMLDAFDHPSAPEVVAGFFRPRGVTLIERTIAYVITPHVSEIDGESFLPSSRSLGLTRSAWSGVGGYPEWLDYCEDLLFDIRLKEQGRVFAFVPNAIVTWSARPSIAAFMKQYYRYARGDGKADLWAKRHLVRYAAYAVGLVLAAISFVQPWALVLLAIGLVIYMQKFWRRIWKGRRDFAAWLLPALAISVVVVVAGDLGKMMGYPVGIAWRRKRGSN